MSLIISLIESAQDHYPWVLLIVFLLTFTKSCALVSLAIPGTSGLLLLGNIRFRQPRTFPVNVVQRQPRRHRRILAIVAAGHSLPSSPHPSTLADRRASGPQPPLLSALWPVGYLFSAAFSLPEGYAALVSGASSLPLWSFQLANVSSGLLWPLLLLAPGAFSLSLW